MISTKLIDGLKPHLSVAEEIWVVVALMKDNAFDRLQQIIPSTTRQHYIVGIDLPTTPSVLRKIMEKVNADFTALLFNTSSVFHPKVYLIKTALQYIGFIGSANLTSGGLENNVELSFQITDQNHCKEILNWFNNIKSECSIITDDFLKEYELMYTKNKFLSATQKSNRDKLKHGYNTIPGGTIFVNADQFFRQSDFDAFNPQNHEDDSAIAKEGRRVVRERLLELHDNIYSRFEEFGIDNLHTPSSRRNYTSQYFHTPRSSSIKDAIWLNYGKSVEQLSLSNDTSFTQNIRIQVILKNTVDEAYIGVWLFIAKQNGSYYDRAYLKKMLDDQSFLLALYEYVIDLGDSYWINLVDDDLLVSDIKDPQDLYDFLIEDDLASYFIIGRNYLPNDSDISNENIEQTVLIEFSKLYKIYQLIEAK